MERRRIGLKAALALTYLFALASPLFTAAPASAVVYCKAVGIPKGCVVRPPAAVVVYCTAPGVPVGCVGRPGVGVGAPGVGVVGAPGVGVVGRPGNRGGPVNRVGVR